MVSKTNDIKKSCCSTQIIRPIRSEFEQLAEASNDAIRIINIDFTIRKINKAFADMTSTNHNTVIGKKCWEVFPSHLCHTPECRLQRIINGEQPIQVEIERTKQDGTIIPCSVTTSPLIDETGKLTGIIEQFRDITEKRQLENQVRESEDRYRALIELGTEAGEAIIMLQDIDGREGIQTYVNDQWSRITGYSENELLGMSFFDLLCAKDLTASIERHRAKMAKKAVPGLYEMSIIHKSGKEVIVELTGGFTNYQGKPANIVYIRDITQRKLLEKELSVEREKYKELFEHNPIATIEVDASELKKHIDKLRQQGVSDFKKYFYANDYNVIPFTQLYRGICRNQAVNTLYEVQDDKEIQDSMTRTLIPHSKHLETAKDLHTALAEGKTYYEAEECIQTATQKTKYVQYRSYIPPGYEDTWSRILITEIDITKLKEKEKRLANAEARLRLLSKKLLKAQEDERSSISRELHDQMGQELISIRLEALSLAKYSQDETIARKSTILAEMIGRLAIMVQQMSLALRPALLDSLGFTRAIKQHALDFERRAGIPCLVSISDNASQKLDSLGESAVIAFRIVQEALTNVLKHSQATCANINVSIEHKFLVVCISDDGKGMDTHKLEDKLFLGILGMQERAQAVGGKVRFRSRPNKGTEVTIRLPIHNAKHC